MTSQWFRGASVPFNRRCATSLLKAVDLLNNVGADADRARPVLRLPNPSGWFFGFLLLVFYYVAQPPFLAPSAEGHYLWVAGTSSKPAPCWR
jgi:hypothetical protein